MTPFKNIEKKHRVDVGWREWCQLPELHIPFIKVKVDTGARTSSLHAENITPYTKKGTQYVKFQVCPIQNNQKIVVNCRAPVFDVRKVRSSNGKAELRYVIKTALSLGGVKWEVEITLTNRDIMRFRMLLGREAMKNVVVIPQRSFLQGRLTNLKAEKSYLD